MNNQVEITIPDKLENMQLPSPELLTFYKNLSERVLWLDSTVDDYFLEFSRKIIEWNRQDKGKSIGDRKPIKLMIYSYGGDLDINNSLVDIIKMSNTPIYGYNVGVCASAGCYIYLACHKRFVMPKAYFLLHKGSADNISGTFDQIMNYIEDYQRKINDLAVYIMENTSIDEKTLEENLGTEWYVDSKQSIEYGIAHAVVSDIDEIL